MITKFVGKHLKISKEDPEKLIRAVSLFDNEIRPSSEPATKQSPRKRKTKNKKNLYKKRII